MKRIIPIILLSISTLICGCRNNVNMQDETKETEVVIFDTVESETENMDTVTNNDHGSTDTNQSTDNQSTATEIHKAATTENGLHVYYKDGKLKCSAELIEVISGELAERGLSVDRYTKTVVNRYADATGEKNNESIHMANGGSLPVTANMRHSPSGTCLSNTPSTWPTRRPPPTWMT